MSGGLVVLATFLAAGVEWVEALTIVLAVAITKGWRVAVVATLAALGALVVLVAVFGFAVAAYIPPTVARTTVGVFLLLFGIGWLYKAILRSTGLKAVHNEAAAYEEAREDLMTHGKAFSTAFSGVFLEGLEVVFIVIALGGLNSIRLAATGALLSLVLVVVAGVAVHRPLTQVPENTIKFAVGLMLTSFGTFFAGEGLGIQWWQSDASVLLLIGGYAVASLVLVWIVRIAPNWSIDGFVPARFASLAVREIWGLFVTDGLLAIFAVAVLLATVVSLDRVPNWRAAAGPVLAIGIVIALAATLRRAAKSRPSAAPVADTLPADDSLRQEQHVSRAMS